MTIHAVCPWTGELLPATLSRDLKAVVWQDGPVADAVEIVLAGERGECEALAGELRLWGYRTVTVAREGNTDD